MNVCLHVLAFGPPNLDRKIEILKNNINILKNQATVLDIFINCYSNSVDMDKISNEISPTLTNGSCEYYQDNGMLLEVILPSKFHTEKKYKKYDLIMMVLDDVELMSDFNLETIATIKNKYNIDIISPKVIGATHKYLSIPPTDHSILVSPELELYCYIADPKSYEKYYNMLKSWNKYMWGFDALMGHFNIRTAVHYNSTAKHYFRDTNHLNKKKLILMYMYFWSNRVLSYKHIRMKYRHLIEHHE